MALERIFPLLALLARVEELHRHSPFNGGGRIALSVRHALDCPCHELEGALSSLPWLGHVAEVVEVDGAGGHRDDKSVTGVAEREDFLGLLVGGGFGGGVARVEELDGGVP